MKKRHQHSNDLSGVAAGSYMQTDELSVADAHNQVINRGGSLQERNGATQIDENSDPIYNIGSINDHRFNQLEMSQNFSSIREPRFCICIPLARGVCCGLISLKIALVIIALIDITIGGSALGIGITAFVKYQLKLQIAAYTLINGICFFLAFGCLYGIAKRNIKFLKFYFSWKCLEVIIIPIFEIVILVTSANNQELGQSISISYYVFILSKALLRAYFAYLIYSFYMRLDRGESLLVEYGQRKLSRMIDEIKEEQQKQQWDLELTERASSRV